MSAEAVGWVYRYSPFTGAAFAVHHALADSTNDMAENEIWARQAWIAAKARVGRQACNGAMTGLVTAGFLEVVEDNAKVARPNRYRFLFPAVDRVFGTEVSPTTTLGVRHDDTSSVAVDDTEPKGSNPTGTSGGDDYSKAFEDAWQLYPRKIEKRAAWRAWQATVRRCGVGVKGNMVKAAANYAKACRGRETSHIKHAATFYGPSETWKEYVDGNPEGGPMQGPAEAMPVHMKGSWL